MSEAELDQLQPHLKAFGEALYQAATTNTGVLAAVEKIRALGYAVLLCLDASMGLERIECAPGEMREPTPLVKDGEIVPDAFTEDDRHIMKGFRIKF
jgi:hypothetical protein